MGKYCWGSALKDQACRAKGPTRTKGQGSGCPRGETVVNMRIGGWVHPRLSQEEGWESIVGDLGNASEGFNGRL